LDFVCGYTGFFLDILSRPILATAFEAHIVWPLELGVSAIGDLHYIYDSKRE
jgi:hypothetical protein